MITPKHTDVTFLNGVFTNTVGSGLSYNYANGATQHAVGWLIDMGYVLVATYASWWPSIISNNLAYNLGTFFANGTVSNQLDLGSVIGPVSLYQDINGAAWMGWTDYDTANEAGPGGLPTMAFWRNSKIYLNQSCQSRQVYLNRANLTQALKTKLIPPQVILHLLHPLRDLRLIFKSNIILILLALSFQLV